MRLFLLALLLLTLAIPALASDGVLEINQTCAVTTGCFADDVAGFPVQIAASGSYLLTSDLIVPDEDTTGILVAASSVQIDLNGFAILGSGCEASTTNCTPASGVGNGIHATDIERIRGVVVKNGSITGMGSSGIYLGRQSEVTNVRVRWNRGTGILVTAGSKVSGNLAFENGLDGIYEGIPSGIDGGSMISGNTAYGNGSYGIQAWRGSIAHGNTIRANGFHGLYAGPQSGYYENTITLNAGGTVAVVLGQNIGRNSCDGAPTCP